MARRRAKGSGLALRIRNIPAQYRHAGASSRSRVAVGRAEGRRPTFYLIANRERVVSKDDLIASVWKGRIVSDAALTTCLNAARTAVGDTGEDQRLIRTLPRKGFRFVGAVYEGKSGPAIFPDRSVEVPKPALALPDKPSIAGLPFQNISGDAEQEYFADGMVEDIITALSRFQSLFVIARNSSFTYKGKAVDIKQVGRELGVRYVLEGSVRK